METAAKEIKFTDDQQQAYDKIRLFLKSSERIFLLTGKAGTGKTTLINYALEDYLEYDRKSVRKTKKDDIATPRVMGVAMAHKAKNNLQERGGVPYVSTFASAYGHREKFTSDGRREFVPVKDKMQYAACKKPIEIFVFDEVSMFSDKMLALIMRETTMYAKIIFMGDRGQLPPILTGSETDHGQDSPVFDMVLPEDCKHELKERVRQTEGNPIVDLSDVIYETIFSNPNWNDVLYLLKILKKDNLDDAGKGYVTIPKKNILDFYKGISEDYLDTKVIAYRRNKVFDYNRDLRNHIHDFPTEIFIPGEIVYMNKTYYGKDHNENSFAFYNASEYIIEQVNVGSIEGIEVIFAFLEEGKAMPVITGVKGDYNHQLYQHRIAKYVQEKDWPGKYAFMDMFGDFNYGYALTAYKAQGSTYRNVFVDVNDIVTLQKISYKRMLQSLYTAITRASDNVYFVSK